MLSEYRLHIPVPTLSIAAEYEKRKWEVLKEKERWLINVTYREVMM